MQDINLFRNSIQYKFVLIGVASYFINFFDREFKTIAVFFNLVKLSVAVRD